MGGKEKRGIVDKLKKQSIRKEDIQPGNKGGANVIEIPSNTGLPQYNRNIYHQRQALECKQKLINPNLTT